ncbi:hypothetical protein [Deinococcus sp. JMULE3]|uniref:hypothetical protein n=1 Tax=Deinococcus sp. JMULE3 TaxID=2518341 RepID=UPI001575D9C4|nr:hypothetical protein [Deinococcus sp. JMULE3]
MTGASIIGASFIGASLNGVRVGTWAGLTGSWVFRAATVRSSWMDDSDGAWGGAEVRVSATFRSGPVARSSNVSVTGVCAVVGTAWAGVAGWVPTGADAAGSCAAVGERGCAVSACVAAGEAVGAGASGVSASDVVGAVVTWVVR